ncbi:MAG: DUF5685 family protein [Planctomycetota bacterium]
MFGFLKGPPRDREYRQAYARCCAFLHLEYGVRTMPVLSYESVFMYLLMQDLGVVRKFDCSQPTCCKFRYRTSMQSDADAWLGEFVAASGLLLVGTKLDDDVRDNGGWVSRFATWTLRKPLEKSREYFQRLDGGLLDELQSHIREHLELEYQAGKIAMDDYVQPTGNAFRRLFRSLGNTGDVGTEVEQQVQQIGYAIGAAIVAFDCGVDWERDNRRGEFNPLEKHGRVPALRLAQRFLADAGWRCEELSPNGISLRVLRYAIRRIQWHIEAIEGRQAVLKTQSRWQTAGRIGKRLFISRPGDCDCDCDCGDCGDCVGPDNCCDCLSAGDSNYCILTDGCCGGPDICCICDPICAGGDCDTSRKKRSSKTSESDLAVAEAIEDDPNSLVGAVGICSGPLKPTGMVKIADTDHPAKSFDNRYLEDGDEVVVVSQTGFGLIVRKTES